MKHYKVLLCAMAVAVICAMPISAAACIFEPPGISNPYSGAWQPTDDDALFLKLSLTNPGSLYLYDFTNPENRLLVFADGFIATTLLYFNETVDGTWNAFTSPEGDSLESSSFGFAFSMGPDSWIDQYGLFGTSGAYGLYELQTKMLVLIHDMQPVPIPPAVLLLGSGLIGVVSLRRRK
jgi:hypothetical protein